MKRFVGQQYRTQQHYWEQVSEEMVISFVFTYRDKTETDADNNDNKRDNTFLKGIGLKIFGAETVLLNNGT